MREAYCFFSILLFHIFISFSDQIYYNEFCNQTSIIITYISRENELELNDKSIKKCREKRVREIYSLAIIPYLSLYSLVHLK